MSVQTLSRLHKNCHGCGIIIIALLILCWLYFTSVFISPQKPFTYSTQEPDPFEQFTDDVEMVTTPVESIRRPTLRRKITSTTLPAVVFVSRKKKGRTTSMPEKDDIKLKNANNADNSRNTNLSEEILTSSKSRPFDDLRIGVASPVRMESGENPLYPLPPLRKFHRIINQNAIPGDSDYYYEKIPIMTQEPLDLSNYRKVYPLYKKPIDEKYLEKMSS